MPRPASFTLDELLDAAAALLAADGPAAVTMSAVARAAGAPSGSMYHRFPTRAALCGELWIRTEERFHAGLSDGAGDIGGTTDAVRRRRPVHRAVVPRSPGRGSGAADRCRRAGRSRLARRTDEPPKTFAPRAAPHAGRNARRPGSGQRGGDRHSVCGCAQAPDRGAGHPRERGRDRRAMRAGTYTC